MSEGADEGRQAAGGEGSPPLRELLTVEVRVGDPAVEAVVRGELDESTAPSMISRIEAAIEADRPLIVDLSGLAFCGSAGLSALIILQRAAEAVGGTLVVRRPTPFMVDLLEIAGLEGLVEPASAP